MSVMNSGINSVKKPLSYIVTATTIILWIIVAYFITSYAIPLEQFGVIFMGFILFIYGIHEINSELQDNDWLAVGALLASTIIGVVMTGYMTLNFSVMQTVRVGYALDYEYIMAAFFVLAILYLSWREYGLPFFLVLSVGIIYGLFGNYLPQPLYHSPLPKERMLRILALNYQGTLGYLVRLTAQWIAIFLLYSGLMRAYGAFDYILYMTRKTIKYLSSGVAQTAVISSAIIGMTIGSQTANAGITGSITIPLMKEQGINASKAAAIESVASTLGQIIPPVMGTAAFLMAALLGIEYVDVMIATIIPTTIAIVSVILAVHWSYLGEGIDTSVSLDEWKYSDIYSSKANVYLDTIKYAVPLIILVYLLAIQRLTIGFSGLITVIAMVALGMAVPIVKAIISRSSVSEAISSAVVDTIEGCRTAAITGAPLVIVIAAINGVVAVLNTTGIASKLTLLVFGLSGGVKVVAIIISMIIGLALGLGMPTSAAYLLVALLIVPTLIGNFAIQPLAAHFFAFYIAILAGLTPPIAPTVAVANGVSGGNFTRACYQAVTISIAFFILPFSFIYHPYIVSDPFSLRSLVQGCTIFAGMLVAIYSLNRYRTLSNTSTSIDYGLRLALLIVGGIVMVYPNILIQAIVLLGGLAILSMTGDFKILSIARQRLTQ